MASAPASVSSDVKTERLSFAKIAAAGIKPPSTQQNSHNTTNSNTQQKQDIASQPRDGTPIVTPSNGLTQPADVPKPKKIVQLVSRRSQGIREPEMLDKSGPEVHVQIVESVPKQPRHHAPEGSLVPALDESGTQVSSSSGSNKPQSLDDKSIASGTNFTLDEKDSLRPDDSASVKAVDEDEMFSPPGPGLPSSRIGSDDGVRVAFRDQLREISSAEARDRPPQILGAPARGVLYVPLQGPGIGAIPNVVRSIPEDGAGSVDCPPDRKLLEALESARDRVWVLKLEQDVIDFVKDPKESSMTLPQCHSFYRLLAHKMADYYMLGHHVEDTSAAVRLYKTPDCRIPPPLTGVTAPSTAASTPPPTAPQMKILRRDNGPAIANGSNMPSKSGSENGDSGDEKKPKGPVSREEREARYEAARLRIMGAKSGDMPDAPKEKQDSRASSATGKRKKNKARLDDDDGFEARSAYANFYNPPYGTEAQAPQSSYGLPDFTDGAHGQYADPYGTPVPIGVNARAPMQSGEHAAWTQTSFDPAQAWSQGQPGGYDLSADFQRSMMFQNQDPAATSPNMGYSTAYGSQYYGPASAWPQQHYHIPQQAPQSSYGYSITSPPPYNQQQQEHSYAFGQLPSQAFPGKAPSKTEHPLPGSYKGKHFNPQSQSFIPGQANTGRPFALQQGSSGSNNAFPPNFSSSAQLQRQTSAQSQGSTFASPHHGSPHHQSRHAMQNRTQSQAPLMHPLPQPVFPRQPSPSLPLPPKPGATPQQQTLANGVSPPHNQQNQSLLAKWGTPASLPAKPPISAEQYEAMKAQQMPRQTFGNPAATSSARLPNIPSPAYPSFGSMPQPDPGQIANVSYSGGNRRT